MTSTRVIAFTKWGFLVGGCLMLAGAGAFALRARAFVARAATAEGTVVDLVGGASGNSTAWYPVIAFETADRRSVRFRSAAGTNPPAYAPGEPVRVLYDPANPKDARIDSKFMIWGAPSGLGAFGVIFASIGGGLSIAGAVQRRRKERLRRNGTRVEATFQRVEPNEALTVNGRHPYRIVAQWLDPTRNEVHVFHSENLWFDPTEYVADKTIPVFVQRGNPRRYVMDVSFLPKLAA